MIIELVVEVVISYWNMFYYGIILWNIWNIILWNNMILLWNIYGIYIYILLW